MKEINIGNKKIGEKYPCFIICDAGVNHNGDVRIAKKLIDCAKAGGADAIKFQTFKTEKLNLRSAPKAQYHLRTTGNDDSWFNLLKSEELSENDHKILVEHCKKRNIIFLSTPYDKESADLLEDLNVPAYKIASTDTNNIPLLKHISKKNKPIILSTGMATMEEVDESIYVIKDEGNDKIVVLQCTSNYPAEIEDCNLRVMKTFYEKFSVIVGYSDHTCDPITPIAAVAAGAKIFERHLTLDRTMFGPDHSSSMEPDDLKKMVQDIRKTEKCLGSKIKKPVKSELENRRILRKSVVSVVDIPRGTIIQEYMIDVKRPGIGLSPKYFYEILGKKAIKNIKKDTTIKKYHIKF